MNTNVKENASNLHPPHRGKLFTTGARLLLGTVFLVFGLNFFFQFAPMPAMPAPAGAFMNALFGSGYLMQLVHLIEIVAGVLLISNRFVPLALTVLAPIVVNIVAFHAFLAPGGLPIALFVLALEIFLARAYWNVFRPMLEVRVTPDDTAEHVDRRESLEDDPAPMSR